MRRGPIVIGATAVGLGAVLSFHTHPSTLTIGGAAGGTAGPRAASGSPPAGPPTPTGSTSPGARTAPSGTSASAPSTTTPRPSTTTSVPSTTRTATGPAVNYDYGVLSVRVTATGRKITNVTLGSIADGGNPLSQSIDQQAVPLLEQEVMQAQGANIQGVSGASYTSAGFAQSLQGALRDLGL